jgi:hypothetical protein
LCVCIVYHLFTILQFYCNIYIIACSFEDLLSSCPSGFSISVMRSLISLSTGVSYSCMVLYPSSADTEKYVHSHPRPQDRNAPTNYLCLVNYLSPFPSYQHQFVKCFPDQFQEWIPIRHNAHCLNITLPDSNLRLAAVSHFHVHAQDL